MSRSTDVVHDGLVAIGPSGWLWPKSGSLYAELLRPLADGCAAAEQLSEDLIDEISPAQASVTLPDYERVLGADPCGRDLSVLSLAERRLLAYQRWTARGGLSRQFFIDYAARRGVTITITENLISQIDIELDFELIAPPEQFIWQVNLPLSDESLFEAGGGQMDDPLYSITISDIECDIRRLKPAHTEVAFIYI